MRARCDKCYGTGVVEKPYLSMTVVPDILHATPHSVWQTYLEDGYTLAEAVAEEFSYGDI